MRSFRMLERDCVKILLGNRKILYSVAIRWEAKRKVAEKTRRAPLRCFSQSHAILEVLAGSCEILGKIVHGNPRPCPGQDLAKTTKMKDAGLFWDN